MTAVTEVTKVTVDRNQDVCKNVLQFASEIGFILDLIAIALERMRLFF